MKAYIFDLDGTLLDSMGLWEQIDVDFLTKRGLDVPPDFINAICARSFIEAALYTIERFELADSVDDLMREWNHMAVYAYGHSVAMKPYAREYLFELKKRGAKLGIATSLPSALYEPALENHGIANLFDAICSTEEVAYGKTKPDIFLLAADRLSVPSKDCVVFEDIPQAIESAKSVGMEVYGILDESSKEHWPWIQKIADGVFPNFKDAPLPELILDLRNS